MNGDISLSEALGGLRIANPDTDDEPSSAPSASASASASTSAPAPLSSSRSAPYPPPSSHSSCSTVTENPQPYSGPTYDSSFSSSLGFDPSDYSAVTPSAGPPPTTYPSDHTAYLKASHRQSVPLAQHQMQYPIHPSAMNASNSYAPNTSRPMSSIYNHQNISGSSQNSNFGTYRYGDEPPQPAIPTVSMVQRSSSRAAATAAAMQQANMLSRDPSRSERGINGVAPPRRSSRRMPPTMPGQSPYSIEGGPLPSSEEWKEKGAAVALRQEVDASGRTVNKVLKKGVKDFNFGRTLGEGSYSTVLAATDRQTLREYAIKVLDKRHIIKEKKVKYVNIEKDTLNRLTDHPGIVRLYYTFQDERSLYFVLDLASNGELLGVLKKLGTFDEECARFYGAQILDAIGHMHSRGVIHRDLKPENVLLDSQMHIKITDFGTAKILDSPRSNGASTSDNPMDMGGHDRANSFVGTAEYVSPELLTDKNACKASDLWAFGCIIYQLLAGRPPFKAANEYQTFQKIVALDYTFPDGFPPVARDLVERLLVLDPVKRLPIEHIRNHAFFDGIKWGRDLWSQKAPRLKPYSAPTEPIRLTLSAPGVSVPGASTTPLRPAHPRLITELPPPSQLDIDWSPVLTRNNERILKLGNLNVTVTPQPHSPHARGGEATGSDATPKKFSRFFGGNTTKKRQRLVMITSSARIILAASGGDEKKAKLELSLLPTTTTWRSFKDAKGLTVWCVDTTEKHLLFEDPKATTSDPDGSHYAAQEWLDTLARAREFALSQSLTNSYSGDSGFNDLGSALSSPTSTLGGGQGPGDALDGVNIPSASSRLRKGDDDTASLRGRKRFSKRHSKNGLAAVF
ncbi:kinase-like protein [Trichodelitschia bisporula]|uniref:non-specific serine/threonine protein kinase n=1 Tax=Trichodelitschia bisporula TaxID=703511 RepID=A0A6G1HXB5_9PEZI|nr:kinase-like protein [Trichodelitschia bisporula]